MKAYDEIKLAFESVAVQKASPLYHALLAEIRRLRKLYEETGNLDKITDADFMGLNKIIRDPKLCGLNATIYPMGPKTPKYARNSKFFTYPTYFTNNYQVMSSDVHYKGALSNDKLVKILLKEHEKIQACFNYKTGQVSGLFAKIPTPIYFESTALAMDAKFPWNGRPVEDEALVGIILHEIGHSIGIFSTVTDNLAKTATATLIARDWVGMVKEERYAVLNLLSNNMDKPYSSDSIAAIVDAEDETTVFALIVALYQNHHNRTSISTLTGSYESEQTAAEFLSDAYAIRMSGGNVSILMALTSGRDLNKEFGAYNSAIMLSYSMILVAIAPTPLLGFGAAALGLLVLFTIPLQDFNKISTYGAFTERLNNGREQLIQMLKSDLQFTLQEKKDLMMGLKKIDQAIKESSDSSFVKLIFGLGDLVNRFIGTKTGRESALKETVQQMNELIHNSVFEKLNEYDILMAERGKQ